MLRVRGSIFLSVAVAAVLAPAATAPAATTAQRFADAVERGKSALRAKTPEFRAAAEALNFAKCERALERKDPPESEAEHVGAYFIAAMIGPILEPAKPALHQIVTDLDAIPTRDPLLKSGRAGWRVAVEYFDRFPALEAPCDQFETWARSGWRKSARPDFDFDGFEQLIADDDDSADVASRKLDRAARRLRRLGVSKGDARRFTGETLFEGLPTLGVFSGEPSASS